MKVNIINRAKMSLPEKSIAKTARRAVKELAGLAGEWPRNYTVNVVFVGRGESKVLNARFLKKPKPANVLSFEYGTFGEIVLTPVTIRREARVLGTSFAGHLTRMVAHGAMHLWGLHHEKSSGASKKFSNVEKKLLERLSVDR